MSNFTDLSTNGVQSETNQKLDSLLEPYFSEHYRERCYPGLVFQQGKRKMVQINVPASDFSGLLQAQPATGNDPDSGKNVQNFHEKTVHKLSLLCQSHPSYVLGEMHPDWPMTSSVCIVPFDVHWVRWGENELFKPWRLKRIRKHAQNQKRKE